MGGADGSMDIFIISVKKCVWGGASVAGGEDSGGDGGNAWRIVGSTNSGATNVLSFCVGICSDDGDGDGWGAMQKID